MKSISYTVLIAICAAVLAECMYQLISSYSSQIWTLVVIGAVAGLLFSKPIRAFIGMLTGMPMGIEGALPGGHYAWVAGMAYLFNAPLAAIVFALELALVEGNMISLMIAAGTGALLHYLYHGWDAVFILSLQPVKMAALPVYIISGAVISLIGIGVMKSIKRIPLIIGAVAISILGWWMPEALGPGYDHIHDLLLGHVTLQLVLAIAFIHLIMLAIAMSAGVQGGIITPLIASGAALGIICTLGLINLFPDAAIAPGIAAVTGMVALLTGSLRIKVAAIIFAFETTHQWQLWLPVLCAAAAAYAIHRLVVRTGKD